MKKYIINQDIQNWERYKLTVLIMLRARIIRKLLFILIMPFFIVLFLSIVTISLDPSSGFETANLMLLVFPSIICLILFVGPILEIKIKFKTAPRLIIDNWGIEYSHNNKTVNIPWVDITEYTELSKYILITQSNNKLNTFIVPKSEFKNQSEIKEFIDFLIEQRLKRN